MKFAEFDWLLIGIAATIAISILLWWSEGRKKKILAKFAAIKLLPKLSVSSSRSKTWTRCILLAFAVLFFFLALAQPQWGSRKREATPSGIDVLIALDVSKSMLARDVRPNRIERVKLGLSNLLEKVKGDRIGLIAFAGSSFLQCPLTLDHSALSRTLREIEVGLIKVQGTDLARPIELASASFSKEDRDRFLILISDGEDLEAKGLRTAKEVAKDGVRIYTIGIGSDLGARIPMDPVGEKPRNYLKDPEGKEVVTRLDRSSLQAVADATGGKYFQLGPTGEGLARVFEELQAIGHRKKHMLLSQELPIERFQSFLALGMILLLIEFLTGNRKNPASLGPGLAIFLLLLCPGCLRKDNVKNAEEAHSKSDFETAAKFYEAEIEAARAMDEKADPRLQLNAGLAYLDAGNLEKAEELLDEALDGTIDEPALQSTILNALGTLYFKRANQWLDVPNVSAAREAWEKALGNYDAAVAIDENEKASRNRKELAEQLEKRIKALLSRIRGLAWRDVDGNGRMDPEETPLPSIVYWDKNGDGEHNSTLEPFIETDEQGRYGLEWISRTYPTSLSLGCIPKDSNLTKEILLIPILPPPPPPKNPNNVKTRIVELAQAKELQVHFPFRAAPMLKGFVWNDVDKDGERDDNETGFAKAKLFLDLDGNLKLDENESSFSPTDSGAFSWAVPPGQHVLCVETQSQEGNLTQTFPHESQKAHLTYVDFETSADKLDFGIHAPPDENQGSGQDQQQSDDSRDGKESKEQKEEEGNTSSNDQVPPPKEVNALYERLLQEIDSNSEQIDLQGPVEQTNRKGRDY